MDYEAYCQQIIFPELENGRPGWDKPHTESVVEHIKTIITHTPELNLDKDVLVIAAYAHDWGYAGLFKGGKPLSLSDVNNAKAAHMVIGAEKLEKLLNNEVFNFLSKDQKDRAVHLVRHHDSLFLLKETDELVLMEADTLGGLDVRKVKPTFDAESNRKYMENVKNYRRTKFITEYGKELFKGLYREREEYYNNRAD
ncbi:MAG: HD domain-containing protein [Candidatus Dojkabacteria bacterium]|nr:MAG: HD domain-containing protein [Candidatus Dojkabacteria bacterium]